MEHLRITSERSTGQMVTDTLRKAIFHGDLKLGERLVEANIAKTLNVSITPVRHAFNQLATEGLINVVPYKGTNVVDITESFIAEVYQIRLGLETLAVELSFPHLVEEDCTILESYADQMGKLAVAGKFEEVAEFDVRFHKLFYEKSGNSILLEMWNILQSRIQLFQTYGRVYSHPAQSGEAFERHMKFVHAIRNKDLATLTRTVKDHIENGEQLLISGHSIGS